MKQISFTIPGEPRVQKRHRDCRSMKYDPSKKDKESFLAQAMAQCRPDKPLTGDLIITLFCYGKYLRGDIDNYLKFVMDALNGIYYVDDKQFKVATVMLSEDKEPRTWASISPWEAGCGEPL